jgi:hypothetical protein
VTLRPAALTWEVRDTLGPANATGRVMLPVADGLGAWLRRHHSPPGERPR